MDIKYKPDFSKGQVVFEDREGTIFATTAAHDGGWEAWDKYTKVLNIVWWAYAEDVIHSHKDWEYQYRREEGGCGCESCANRKDQITADELGNTDHCGHDKRFYSEVYGFCTFCQMQVLQEEVGLLTAEKDLKNARITFEANREEINNKGFIRR